MIVGKKMSKRQITALEAKNIKQPGRHRAGHTLYLHVSPEGTKSWIQRITIHGKRRDIGLGAYPSVSLTEARERAFHNNKLARAGGDPHAEMKKAGIPTFREAARKTYEANLPRWRSGKHVYNWWRGTEKYVFPVIGDMRVDKIGQDDVLRILTPLWSERTPTARKLRQRIRTVLSWCQAHGYIELNVAGELIDGALPAMPTVKAHFRALPYQEVPMLLETVEGSKSDLAAKLCFRFIVLTAARSGEARGATWAEIDFETREWRIPGSRMKTGTEHRVPLSGAALAVLEQAKVLRNKSDLVFPSPTRPFSPLSDMTLTKILRTTGYAVRTTIHGLRSAFRTWAQEQTNAPHAVMEMSLSHQVGSAVVQAYARSDLMGKRRHLMESWATFITAPKKTKVVRLRNARTR